MADFDIDEALDEVQNKKEEQIETETAYRWASRSCACYQLHKETGLIKWLLKAEDYCHEALEHAALAKDNGKTLKIIEAEIKKYRTIIDDKKTTEVKEANNFYVRQQKMAQLFRDAEPAVQAILSIINTMTTYINPENAINFRDSVRRNLAKINTIDAASKKMPGGARVAQVVNIVKHFFSGQDESYIADVLSQVIGKI
jgi:hypothetical protein